MARLPTPGGDNGNWGSILNDFLSTVHDTDGSLKDNSVAKTKLATNVQTSLDLADTAIPASQKGTPSGVATLDSSSKLTTSQLPEGVVTRAQPRRVSTIVSSAAPILNVDNTDLLRVTGQAVDITSMTTNLSGTPVDGQSLLISITGTASRAITWGASFESSTISLPTTTSGTDRLDVGFLWNVATSKWRCVAVA